MLRKIPCIDKFKEDGMDYILIDFTENKIKVSDVIEANNSKGQLFTQGWNNLNLEEAIELLVKNIDALGLDGKGGVIVGCYPYFIKIGEQTFKLSDYLTERLNRPMVFKNELNPKNKISTALEKIVEENTWNLNYYGYPKGKEEYSIESLLTVGNGFMGLRGTVPEMKISDDHYPATYLASLYNQAESIVAGKVITNEDFVNAPNMQYISVRVGSETVTIKEETLKYLHRQLALKTGLFQSKMILELADGKQIELKSRRVANMQKMNNYSIEYFFKPLNFSGEITIISESDGDVINHNVARYRSLNSKHLNIETVQANGKDTLVVAKTNQSKIKIIQKSRLYMGENVPGDASIINECTETGVVQSIRIEVKEGQCYSLSKSVQIYSYREAQSQDAQKCLSEGYTGSDFETNLNESSKAWEKLWEKSDIQIKDDMMSQKMLRLHTFHLLCSASPNSNPKLDASVTARGLHGEAYRGHIFWDEIFILPFYVMHYPETAKQLLMYRYNRLDQAKADAKLSGYKGAMFPWQSGLDGTEQSQVLHLNPLNGEWGEDHSRLQRHVSLAVAYNIWFYCHNTHDFVFLKEYGAEMMLEIAHFWMSAATFDEKTNRYFIDKVMGPDEFHEAYPGSSTGGVKNNAYTNMMVVWLFEEIDKLKELLSELDFIKILNKVGMTKTDLSELATMKHNLELDINEDGIIAQYEGFLDLEEIDWNDYRSKYKNIYRMDRILSAEGKSADDYQVSKQADTLMMFYNFGKGEIDKVFAELGYQMPSDYLTRNLEYYLDRTSHGSTLSRIVHAQLANEVDKKELAWKLYQEALFSDYRDIQGGTTAEGIHAGVMAATIYVTLTTFGGLDMRESELVMHPQLPKQWTEIKFNMTHRQIEYMFVVTEDQVLVKPNKPSTIKLTGRKYTLTANEFNSLSY